MPKPIDLSVILTGYNEGGELEENLERVKKILESTRFSWEMILYDDASYDETPKVFKKFASKNKKNVRAFFHAVNCGRGLTVKDAVKKSRGGIVGYIDTDLELSPVHIPEFAERIEKGADLAIATRIYKITQVNVSRAIASLVYVSLVRLLFGVSFKDTESGLKFFRKSKLLDILDKVEDERWFFDTEIVLRSFVAGLEIAEIPAIFTKKPEKQSTVNLFEVSFSYIVKLWSFRKSYQHPKL